MLKAELETVKAEKAALEKELSELKVGTAHLSSSLAAKPGRLFCQLADSARVLFVAGWCGAGGISERCSTVKDFVSVVQTRAGVVAIRH